MPKLLKKAVDVAFDKKKKPAMFLSSFFEKKQLDGIKVEVQSRTIKSIYSVDVKLGTGGRRVDLSKYDKTEYVVPEYNDFSDITEEDMLNAQFGETEYEAKTAKAADLITDRQEIISDSQRRAEEKQASDALFNGKVVLANGDEIEYNKLDTHSIDLDGREFDETGTDAPKILKDACKLCRDDGKIGTSVFHLIMEDDGLAALLGNAKFIANCQVQAGIDRTKITMPEELTAGATFHGQFAVGTNKINVWTYNEKYEIPTGFNFAGEGTEVGYIPSGCAILLPDKPKFRRYYGAVNSVDASTGSNVGGAKLNLQKKEQAPYSYDTVENGSAVTKAGVKSRPLLVPVDINSFATLKNIVK